MTGSVPLARRNLFGQRARFLLSVGGVGLALLLVLTLDAVFAGVERDVSAYVDHTRAGAIISQRGVRTMHMSQSAVPLSLLERVRGAPGVAGVAPILFTSSVLTTKQSVYAYLIGYRSRGGPWKRVAGARRPGPSGVILDETAADRLKLKLGDHVRVAGVPLRVDGLTRGTTSIINSVAFIDYATFARAAHSEQAASYLLAWPKPGVSNAALVRTLQARLPESTVQTPARFAAQERRVIGDMSTDLIGGMTLIGFIVGVAVAGLSIYTSTTARLREYAVLRAIGLRARPLYALVFKQALITVFLGLVFGLVMLGLLSLIIGQVAPTVTLTLTAPNLIRATLITALMALVASLFPARKVTRIEPASVYRA